MAKVLMEMEVEYVRRKKLTFWVDPGEGMGDSNTMPIEVSRVLRQMHCRAHQHKDLGADEKPRILSWNVVPRRNGLTLSCGCWDYGSLGVMAGSPYKCKVHGPVTITQCNVAEPDELYLSGVE